MKTGDVETVVRKLQEKIPPEKLVNVVKHSHAGGEWQTEMHQIQLRTKPIVVACPMDEVLFGKSVRRMFAMDIMPWDMKLFVSSTYVPDARNKIHNAMFDCGYEWLYMMDSDTTGPFDLISRLIAHNKPVVSGWYPAKMEDREKVCPVVYDYVKYTPPNKRYRDGQHHYKRRDEIGQGVEQVDGVGAGCMLMHRDVVKALGKFPYDMNTGGEDLVLCTKLRELGIPIFVDWDLRCKHAGVDEW